MFKKAHKQMLALRAVGSVNIARYKSGLILTTAVGLLSVAALTVESGALASPPEVATGWVSTGALNTAGVVQTTLSPTGQVMVGGGWTSIGPSPAGVAASITADPNGTGTLFIGSAGGGVRKSTDNGRTWSSVNTGLTNLVVATLAMDASGPHTLYAGTALDGVFKTIDGGATWQKLAGMAGTVVNALAADPKQPGVVYAGLIGGVIRKTSNGGTTWVVVFTGTTPISNIAFDPKNSAILYIASIGGGAFKSVNAGQSWSALSTLTPKAICSLALDPTDSQVLYAGTNEDGVWKSTDAGTTWQRQGSPDFHSILSLTVDPSPEHTVYAGTAGGGVWQSFDGASSWQPTGLSGGIALSLAMGPTRILYAGTGFIGAQVSSDFGATWSDLDPGLGGANSFSSAVSIDPADNKKIFVSANWCGLIASQDGGATWAIAGRGFTSLAARQVVFDPSNSQRIYAGSFYGGGLFKSEDGGLTWSRRRMGSAGVYLWALAVNVSSPNIVYAGTLGDGLFKSTNFGDTWAALGSGLPRQVQGLALDPSDTERMFAATPTGVFRSEDGGVTWTSVLNKPAWNITIRSNVPSTVYATTRTEGVFRSLDGGSTWQDLSTGLTTPSSRIMGRSAPVIIDPTNPLTLYVGGEGGVFNSRDGGDHWSVVNSGLGNVSVWGLVMDPSNPAILYTSGTSGVYKTVTGGELTAHPIDDAQFFVRHHYLDFLNREPDQGGWDYWTERITECGDDPLCVHRRRIDVSAAFFVELEFQETGYVVYRLHRAAHGEEITLCVGGVDLQGNPCQPRSRAKVVRSQFVTDRAQLDPDLPQSTINFANNFVQRPEFKQAYPEAMTPSDFVNKLFDTANLTGSANASLRQAAIDALTNGSRTRAQVLLEVIEISEFKTREYNPAFVLMQYFGYLRRDPDEGGYYFWLDVLNNRAPNNFRAMVCAFLTSAEYQRRFGSVVTRTNRDCSQ